MDGDDNIERLFELKHRTSSDRDFLSRYAEVAAMSQDILNMEDYQYER